MMRPGRKLSTLGRDENQDYVLMYSCGAEPCTLMVPTKLTGSQIAQAAACWGRRHFSSSGFGSEDHGHQAIGVMTLWPLEYWTSWSELVTQLLEVKPWPRCWVTRAAQILNTMEAKKPVTEGKKVFLGLAPDLSRCEGTHLVCGQHTPKWDRQTPKCSKFTTYLARSFLT